MKKNNMIFSVLFEKNYAAIMKKVILSFIILHSFISFADEDDIQFNINILNAEDRENINLAVFSRDLYIVPGVYPLKIYINNTHLPEEKIHIVSLDGEKSEACLTPDIVEKFNLNKSALSSLEWQKVDELTCLSIASLSGMTAKPELSNNSLTINIPKMYQEYSTFDWEPASRWEDGITGVISDYSLTSQYNHSLGNNYTNDAIYLSGLGVIGANLNSWRIRGHWQGTYNHIQTNKADDLKELKWNNIYAYRAVRGLKAKLIVGEDYLQSDLFDSFKYTGIALRSDDNMLPPNLRSYAPEVTGFAETNAIVKISQDGRIIYESLVPAGPFRIQSLNSGISGTLQVVVEESDGRISEFEVEATNVPFLSRPGTIRYKISTGRPTDLRHHVDGDLFAQSEISLGVNNGWSLFGGAINSHDYNAFSIGIGRDLSQFGAVSTSLTQSISSINSESTHKGKSIKIDYYKSIQEQNSQLMLSTQRVIDREFMTMADFINYNNDHEFIYTGFNKNLYTASMSKNFTDWRSSMNLSYNHQTYWNRPNSHRYNLTFSKYSDTDMFSNVGLSINIFSSKMQSYRDNGAYMSISVPFSSGTNINYSTYNGKNDNTNKLTANTRIDTKNNASLSVGNNRHSALLSGYYSHKGNNTDFNSSFNYISNSSINVSSTLQGGMTLTSYGSGFHPITALGGTRIIVDTNGVKDVPIKYNGSHIRSNYFGTAIVPDLNSYYKSNLVIDINQLPKNVEVAESVTQSTLTEGAIGYRNFDVIYGLKLMTVVRLKDGSYPPFASDIKNKDGKVTGIIGDQGEAYIGGIRAGETMNVSWQGSECVIQFPENIEEHNVYDKLLLSCN